MISLQCDWIASQWNLYIRYSGRANFIEMFQSRALFNVFIRIVCYFFNAPHHSAIIFCHIMQRLNVTETHDSNDKTCHLININVYEVAAVKQQQRQLLKSIHSCQLTCSFFRSFGLNCGIIIVSLSALCSPHFYSNTWNWSLNIISQLMSMCQSSKSQCMYWNWINSLNWWRVRANKVTFNSLSDISCHSSGCLLIGC